jgi:dolichol-phosphate mannosyltransferase
MTTLVVLPTYNEAETIVDVLRRVRACAETVDVLVVDDSSPDGTADLAEAVALEIGRVDVLRRPGKAGLGSAYRTGFRVGLERGYGVLVEMDSDLSHDPAALPALIAAVESGKADLAIGTRYIPGGSIPDWSWSRRAISRVGCLYARLALGISAHDATSGFRAYTRHALEQVDLDRVKADGYGFQVEMVYLVERNGGRVAEVPIEFRDRTLGHSKMSSRIVMEALVLVTWWGLRDRLPRPLRPNQ